MATPTDLMVVLLWSVLFLVIMITLLIVIVNVFNVILIKHDKEVKVNEKGR